MEYREFEVNENNVKECWKYYEAYMEEYRKTHYSDDVDYDDFVYWCENELMECPNCGEIVLKDRQDHLNEPYNPENVCNDCIEVLDYGK